MVASRTGLANHVEWAPSEEADPGRAKRLALYQSRAERLLPLFEET